MKMTKDMMNIDEKEIMEKDVKKMSYEDLMAAVRFLDKERETLAANINIKEKGNKRLQKQEKMNRVA